MPFATINESGCGVWHGGLVKVRFDLFLTPEDKRYDERYILVPVFPPEGYPGELDKGGNPKNQADYDAWWESLTRIWQLNPFHSHILRFEPADLATPDKLEAAINHHIPNFYSAWCQEYDKLKGGMRKGWDVATRPKAIGRPRRYDLEMNPSDLAVRRLECQSKLDLIVKANLSIQSTKEGETFPSTEIDVGPGAIGRTGYVNPTGYTLVDCANPANDTGTIDTWELYYYSSASGVKVGTFSGSGLNWDDRDYESIGDVAEGDKRTFTGLDNDVETDDVCGVYSPSGQIEADSSGGTQVGALSGDQFGGGSQTYDDWGAWIISIYGTGETIAVIGPFPTHFNP
jgi:hypothetical protein